MEFTSEWRQIGETFYGYVRSQRTKSPAEIGPFTEKQVRVMNNIADAIWTADGGELRTYRRNSEGYRDFYRALKAATRREDHGVTEAGVWRRRLARYLADRAETTLDPADKDDRLRVLEEFNGEPFLDPQGRVWVNVGSISEFYGPRHLGASDQVIAAALKHLGFERRPVQERVPETDSNRKLTYWRSPSDYDWRSEP